MILRQRLTWNPTPRRGRRVAIPVKQQDMRIFTHTVPRVVFPGGFGKAHLYDHDGPGVLSVCPADSDLQPSPDPDSRLSTASSDGGISSVLAIESNVRSGLMLRV